MVRLVCVPRGSFTNPRSTARDGTSIRTLPHSLCCRNPGPSAQRLRRTPPMKVASWLRLDVTLPVFFQQPNANRSFLWDHKTRSHLLGCHSVVPQHDAAGGEVRPAILGNARRGTARPDAREHRAAASDRGADANSTATAVAPSRPPAPVLARPRLAGLADCGREDIESVSAEQQDALLVLGPIVAESPAESTENVGVQPDESTGDRPPVSQRLTVELD